MLKFQFCFPPDILNFHSSLPKSWKHKLDSWAIKALSCHAICPQQWSQLTLESPIFTSQYSLTVTYGTVTCHNSYDFHCSDRTVCSRWCNHMWENVSSRLTMTCLSNTTNPGTFLCIEIYGRDTYDIGAPKKCETNLFRLRI